MKKLLTVITICLSMMIASIASASKMDLPLQLLVKSPTTGKAILGKGVSARGDVELVDVIIKSMDVDFTAATIIGAGGTVRSTIGNIMTAYVPVDFLNELEAFDEIKGIEASRPMRNLMDTARANTGVTTLQAGYDGITYNGENVVVGVLDTGLDYTKSDFNSVDGVTRVQYMGFQSASADGSELIECAHDTIVDGSCSVTGNNDAAVGHGTHVTGIAAGSDSTYTGVASAADILFVRNDFYDDIEEENANTFSAGLLDGIEKIFKLADILDKPAVINISQGAHIGAHDNTSLLEQGINSAVAGEYASNGKNYGRSIVAAAGNTHVVYDLLNSVPAASDRAGGVHGAFSVSDGNSSAFRLWILVSSAIDRTPLIADVWFGQGEADNCSIAANAYSYVDAFDDSTSTSDAVAATGDMSLSTDDNTSSTSGDNKVITIVAVDAEDSQNQKPRGLVGLRPGSSGSWSDFEIDTTNWNTGYVMDVIIRASGGACTGNLWIEMSSGTYVNFMKNVDAADENIAGGDNGNAYSLLDGDNDMTVMLPGTASGLVTVGAYLQEKPFDGTDKSQWTDMDGTTYDATDVTEPTTAQINGGTVSQRCPFSSIGPTADGRLKPDILAPGDPIISTLPEGYKEAYENSNGADSFAPLQVNETHYKNQGTSQASPHVAGLVALMFQKNNTLTLSQVKDAITSTGTAAQTIGKASYEVGYGNVQAVSAIATFGADTSGYSGTGDLTTEDLEEEEDDDDDSSSSGGCGGSIAPFEASNAAAIAFFLVAPIIAVAVRRRRNNRK